MTPDLPLLTLNSVSRQYGSPPTTALDDVSFTVNSGEMVAITGPSGSGKSTLLNLVGTLDRASDGEITIAGHRVSAASDAKLSALRAHLIGFVFQQYHLEDAQTAADNVATGLLYTGMPLRERRARAREALDRVGLGDRAHHTPRQLSGGQRQRVAIARAVVGDPPLLLADEPTGALDTRSGAQVVDILKDLNRTGTTVLVITHDRELAAGFPRQISIRDGVLESDTQQ
ncbi:ABC transporter ATP-binding protein [Helcobacillus massiliensis]|uniref:Putative ABC transport system ATP-binding protein n=1 Tax=Helcobacillus massiliensis TaxID=521392 RepID=A0A839QUK4_9MICO|nr:MULTISPECIES: ABC transporter ATP-binding protein [Helcobacillus]MBB3022460.1 putative ABC transport system ATP-binding protein [Helcobacillus massiliensis]MCG7427327.1 ABC transporter ATP-binding protein [Helcobacillus sp. ACRRO]MCT1557096.1 ABC transporter ATP-binding protein [Helcobacillus massiliensis]MCT2036169.1 ABC transporter ATP-binding protein [Helcobacillus massiliensis]MCT2331300.1 ABC transporter ATP-binding protein [Helcobacillus massiliensis]